MNQIKAEVLARSINPQGDELITYLLVYPRFIHSELMTHRMFSRNSASSRAIPFERMVKMVEEDPFIPIAWQKSHKGMQGNEYFTDSENIKGCVNEWLKARDYAVQQATVLNEDLGYGGVTKQLCNRLLEPFMWHTTLVTTSVTEESLLNFFELRCPKYSFGEKTNKAKVWKSRIDALRYFPDWKDHNDLFWLTMNKSQAEIHIQALAEAMWDARNESTPKQLKSGEFHIPFGDNINEGLWGEDGFDTKLMNDSTISQEQREEIMENIHQKIATARCARLSYMTFDNEINYQKDIELHDRLLASHHMSPFEHVAVVATDSQYRETYIHRNNNYEHGWFNNFKGFIQYRYLIENNYDLQNFV